MKIYLEHLATRPTFLWEHLQSICSDTQTLEEEAELLTVFTLIDAWGELARRQHWATRLGREWSAQVARDESAKVASSARRLMAALDGHRDLAGFPSAAYLNPIDPKDIGGVSWGDFSDPSNPKHFALSPPLWKALTILAAEADLLAKAYGTGRKAKVNRANADVTHFLRMVCRYLAERFPTTSVNRLCKIADALTTSAFAEENGFYEESAKAQLKEFKWELTRNK